MIKNLKEIKKQEVDLFGGKATNLGFLIQNGFNVPEGFAIPTEVKKLTEEIKKEILEKFKSLNSPVSVRSSATCEDSSKSSFAGQFDTFLNIKTEKELLNSIEKCWDSANSERVKAYIENKGIKKVKMAVIIQKMVDADFAGVVFTVDPVEKKNILIEITQGLGDKLVSGKITPSSFFVNKDFKIVKGDNSCSIKKDLIIKISKVGKDIEKIYSKPQDIEFCIKNKEIFILQSRPITTL